MPVFRKNVKGLNQAIDHLLALDPSKGWSASELATEAASLAGYKSKVKLQTIIETRLSKGVDSCHWRGSKPVGIKFKPEVVTQPNGGNNGPDPRVASLQTAVAKASEKITELMTELEDEKSKAPVDRIIGVTVKTKTGTKVVKGLYHDKFERILKLAQARKNIFLYGPTGSGKSFICQQVAEALGLSFSFVSCTAGMSEGVIGGRLMPIGDAGKFEYVKSEFIEAYENGGVFLLDEIDAADPNVLLFINAALANGRVAISNRPDAPYAEQHEDFVCIAAANTVGTGGDRMYSGRNKLDASTMDRFQIGKVMMSYDDRVEADLCPDDELREMLLLFRQRIMDNKLERAMSTRFMKDAYQMFSEFDWTLADICDAFFEGWREDEIRKVKGSL